MVTVEFLVWGLVCIVIASATAAHYVYFVRRRLEQQRDDVARRSGVEVDDAQFSKLSLVEQEILRSEVLWNDQAGRLRDRIFNSLDKLTATVERFNLVLETVPSLVEQRVPSAVQSVSQGLETSAMAFSKAGDQFALAAQRINSYGETYAQRMDGLIDADRQFIAQQASFDRRWQELREQRLSADQEALKLSDNQFRNRQHQFDARWASLLEERLNAERDAIALIREKTAQMERSLELVVAQRVEAENLLIQALKEKTNALKTGRISIG